MSATNYPRIIAAIEGTPWAIEAAKGQAIANFLTRKLNGETIPRDDIQAAVDKNKGKPRPTQNGTIAMARIYGTIMPRADILMEFSGGTSAEAVGRWMDYAAADDSVKAIILDFDSPGGNVSGVPELANKIYAASKRKKVTAVVNTRAASAAYWLASQCSEIVCSPSSEVGSLGVFIMHTDISKATEARGEKVTFISAGELKTAGNPHEPLGDVARGELQRSVDDFYGQFVRAVARGRRTTSQAVRDGFGRGGMVRAEQAVKEGMADRIGTIDSVLNAHGYGFSEDGERLLSLAGAALRPEPTAHQTYARDPEVAKRRERMELEEKMERYKQELREEEDRDRASATTTAPVPTPTAPGPHDAYIAAHESGHLVIRWMYGDRQCCATIVPRDGLTAAVTVGKQLDLFEEAVCDYAGEIAAEYSGCPRPQGGGGAGDMANAAKRLESYQWMHAEARNKARKIIGNNMLAVRAMAAELVERRTMDAADIGAVLSRFSIG